MATELARRQIDSVAIARAGGWNSVETVKRYTNEAELEHGAIATAFGGSAAPDAPATAPPRRRRPG